MKKINDSDRINFNGVDYVKKGTEKRADKKELLKQLERMKETILELKIRLRGIG